MRTGAAGGTGLQKKKEAAFEEPVAEVAEEDAAALAGAAQELEEWKTAGRKGELVAAAPGGNSDEEDEEEQAPEKKLLTVSQGAQGGPARSVPWPVAHACAPACAGGDHDVRGEPAAHAVGAGQRGAADVEGLVLRQDGRGVGPPAAGRGLCARHPLGAGVLLPGRGLLELVRLSRTAPCSQRPVPPCWTLACTAERPCNSHTLSPCALLCDCMHGA